MEYAIMGGTTFTYKIELLGSKDFKVIETIGRGILGNTVTEWSVDTYGKVYKSSGDGSYIGSFSPIWIPVNKMKIGDVFDEDHHVMKRMSWKKWEVLVVENTAGASIGKVEDYFDATTGFKVGTYVSAGGEIEIILMKTNVSGLEAGE
ncbi:MAG: hypothetical protein GXO96_08925 [Nitrospirae bacterium]|nr:hypothetical protein [Candidatus Manganitrophaceae bacterium]